VNDDKADFLISPYSSGLADAAAVMAEQYNRIMITAGAASDSTHAKGYNLVFQSYTPASRYLTGAFDLLAKLDPNAKKVAIIHENDKFSTDVSNAAKAYAESKGFQIVTYEGYDTGSTDFAPFINKIPADADAIMVAVARGLMAEPVVLMFDELSLGLSPMLVLQLFDTLRKLKAEGLTMLLVEQNVHMALAVSDYAYVLNEGKIWTEGPARAVAQNPAVRQAYLGI
jgi:ABC-type antimicrobial peptide transport system ATPase subunit